MKKWILCLVVLLIPVAVTGNEAATRTTDVGVAAPSLPVGSSLFPFAIDTAMNGSCVFQCQQEYYDCILDPYGDVFECRADRDACFSYC